MMISLAVQGARKLYSGLNTTVPGIPRSFLFSASCYSWMHCYGFNGCSVQKYKRSS